MWDAVIPSVVGAMARTVTTSPIATVLPTDHRRVVPRELLRWSSCLDVFLSFISLERTVPDVDTDPLETPKD
jgi:hypothetical protein